MDHISKHRDAWIDVMMAEELGIIESDESPIKNAVATFLSFAIFGFVPLAAHVVGQFVGFFDKNAFVTACLLTGLTLFALGAAKARITGRGWLRSGGEMLLVGGVAAAAAYGIGSLLSRLA